MMSRSEGPAKAYHAITSNTLLSLSNPHTRQSDYSFMLGDLNQLLDVTWVGDKLMSGIRDFRSS